MNHRGTASVVPPPAPTLDLPVDKPIYLRYIDCRAVGFKLAKPFQGLKSGIEMIVAGINAGVSPLAPTRSPEQSKVICQMSLVI